MEGRYNITPLDHNTVCYHFAFHPFRREYIKVHKVTGDMVYTGHINRQMCKDLLKNRRMG